MKKLITTIFIILGTGTLLFAQKITSDVDKTYDMSRARTFGFSPGPVAPSASTSSVIVSAVEAELRSRGLSRNDAAPDMRLSIMAAADMDLQGVGPSWNNSIYRSWGGYGNPAALMTVTKGTLLIDLIDTKTDRSIWRGVAKDVFISPTTGDPVRDAREMENLVKETVNKLFKRLPLKRIKD